MANPIMTLTMANGKKIVAEQKIASIRVDTQGETYPEPEKLADPYGRF